MTSSLRGKRRTTASSGLAFLLLLPTLLPAQRPDAPPPLDRYAIDVAAIVRDGTARTISEVLISQVPGLLVIPGSGLNGAGASIRFAGVRSFVADRAPVVLLDGTRIDIRENDSQLLGAFPGPSRLDDVAVEDVESIEVLRGPAGTARYGPGAEAGVILIRTKSGRSGPLRMEGFVDGALRSMPSHWPANYGGVDVDNPTASMKQGGCSLSYQAQGLCVQDFVQKFNPLVERNPFTSAAQRQVGLSATAGPEWGAFRVSGSWDGHPASYAGSGVTWNDDYRRWNVGASAALQPAKNLDVATRVSRLSSTLRLPMYLPVLGALLGPSDSAGFSWASMLQSPGTQDVDRTQFGVDVTARPLPWLGLQAAFGLEDVDRSEFGIVPGTRTTARRTGRNRTIAFNASIPDREWHGLRFTTTLGIERLSSNERVHLQQLQPETATGCGFGAVSCFELRSRSPMTVFGIYAIEQIGLGRGVFVTGSLRHDAFDQFKSWSTTHPSVALDWIVRPDEPGVVGRVALRAAYGSAGHALPVGLETFFISPGLSPAPPPLEPERTRGFELSAEASGLERRWHAQASIYDLRSDVIDFSPASAPSGGFVQAYVNGAGISNRGVTAAISARVIDRGAWGWDVRLSFWGNRNRLVKLGRPPHFYGDFAGFAQGEFEGYPANGYWGTPITGFADANGDGIISAGEVFLASSRTWAGTPYPTQGAALSSSVRFARRWRLSATFDYRAGQTLFNQTANYRCRVARCRERIDPATPLAEQAVALAANQGPLDYFEDADYLKLRELALVFEVPEQVASVLGARAATVLLGGRDLLTWTSYSGGDPETGSYGRDAVGAPRIVGDFATVPVPRSWTLRVRVSY